MQNTNNCTFYLALYNLNIDYYSLNKTYGLYNVEQLHLS